MSTTEAKEREMRNTIIIGTGALLMCLPEIAQLLINAGVR